MRRYQTLARATAAMLVACALFIACTDSESPQRPAALLPPLRSAVAPPPSSVLLAAGDIARCDRTGDEATAALLDLTPSGTVVALGDAAYDSGTVAQYNTCYDPSWGRHKARTLPIPGDYDYKTTNAAGYFGYFGASAGDPTQGYYSYDLGDWHLVALNSGIAMSKGSPQELWLKADLANSTKLCTLAYFHLPRYYSGTDTVPRSSVKPLWKDLYAADAEIVLGAHTRNYERFAPQDTDAVLDSIRGIREFVVGTGGLGPWPFYNIAPNSEVRGQVNGVLKLTLYADSYAWQFVPVAGTQFSDTGSYRCHGNTAPIAKPGGPYAAEGPLTLDGSASFSPSGSNPLTHAWDFGDGTTASGATPSHTYTTVGTYTVTLTVTDALGSKSAPATTTAALGNFPATVTIGGGRENQFGDPLTLPVSFSDPGTDGPWTYSVNFGDDSETTNGSVATQAPLSFTHTYATRGTYTVHVSVTDAGGAEGAADASVVVRTAFVGAGDIADCTTAGAIFTSALLDSIPGVVFTTGDNAYPSGTSSDYANCYAPTWGRHKPRTRPVPGNHEYATDPTAGGYFGYYGAAAADPGKGYYSYDLGDWHIIAVNSELDVSPGSAEMQWLRADLAASAKRCTLAYWHEPRWISTAGTGHHSDPKFQPVWDTLYAYGAELVVNGHKHSYERFAPQTPAAAPDAAYGIRELIAGTGGEVLDGGDPTPIANSEVRETRTWGVLKLTLNADSYSWQFVPAAGWIFSDSGTTACHDAPAPNHPPTAAVAEPPTGSEGAAVSFDGTGSSDPDGDPLAYAWSFGDGTTGAGVNPTHAYADNGSYTVTLTVTDRIGATSSATTTVSITNVAPSVNAGADLTVNPGASVTVNATFSDPGASDAPWAYTINWGDGSAQTTGSGTSQSSAITATHIYPSDGTNTVLVTVTDKDGGAGSSQLAVTVLNHAPTAVPGGPYTGSAGSAVGFDGSGSSDPDGDALTYAWSFGDGATGTGVKPSHSYLNSGTYTVVLTVTDSHGASSSQGTSTATITNAAPSVLVGAGNIAKCNATGDEQTANLLDNIPGTVFAAGDNDEDGGTITQYNTCYGPSWGRHKARTAPTPGDLDYRTSGAAGYFGYFGAAAGDPTKGYYSYDLGAWHIIVLNSGTTTVSTAAGSPQELWLKADLAAHPARCTLAYWHHPLFSSKNKPNSTVLPLWNDLYAAGVELVINAHYGFYERFAPQTPAGAADAARGIRELIVGTGGAEATTFGSVAPNSEVRISRTFGVLKLTLAGGSYSWQFIPVAGKTITDSGSGTCH